MLPRKISSSSTWKAREGCPAHHVVALERAINALPAEWLQTPRTGEYFDSLLEAERRLRGFSLAEGFDVVKNGGGTKAVPGARFNCIFYGEKTKNWRKLPERVQRDEEGQVLLGRQREHTNVRQASCTW